MSADITLAEIPENRREAMRLEAAEQPLHLETPNGASGEATLIDVSRTGLRFRSRLDLPVGSEVVVYPPDGGDLQPLRMRISRRIVLNGSETAFVDYGAAFADPANSNRHAWFLNLRKAA